MEPHELPGTVWQRDGSRREITRVEKSAASYDVYWKRPGGNERKLPVWLPYFRQWLAGAEMVCRVGETTE
jgi:hypothetical protein